MPSAYSVSYFNPRSPHGERQFGCKFQSCQAPHFNPRSPHGERHASARRRASRRWNFNPRSPHGERLGVILALYGADVFQSTLPARGATDMGARECEADAISIHAPRTGSDSGRSQVFKRKEHFNPRFPHGERLLGSLLNPPGEGISIHAPRTGSDALVERLKIRLNQISIHAPRTGSDGTGTVKLIIMDAFQSTLPARGATRVLRCGSAHKRYFNPRSPHGERRYRC